MGSYFSYIETGNQRLAQVATATQNAHDNIKTIHENVTATTGGKIDYYNPFTVHYYRADKKRNLIIVILLLLIVAILIFLYEDKKCNEDIYHGKSSYYDSD